MFTYFYYTYIHALTITAFAINSGDILILSQTIILNSSSVKYSLNTSSGDSGMATVGPTGESKSWIFSGMVFLLHDVGRATTTGGDTSGCGSGGGSAGAL